VALGAAEAARHFEREIILWCVKKAVYGKLPCVDLVESLAVRGVAVREAAIERWVARYGSEIGQPGGRYAVETGSCSQIEEIYLRLRGIWCHFYRAVDRDQCTIDFWLSEGRDVAGANEFFTQELGATGRGDERADLWPRHRSVITLR